MENRPRFRYIYAYLLSIKLIISTTKQKWWIVKYFIEDWREYITKISLYKRSIDCFKKL